MSEQLSAEHLRSLLDYDPLTGDWTWRVDRKTGRGAGRLHIAAGSKAGTLSAEKGYRKIGIDGRRYWAHRLAFLWMTGEWPAQHVDHIDGDGGNDAWQNLRDVSRSVNMQNRRHACADSASGILGVSFNKSRSKWVAQLTTGKQNKGLGYFDTAEAASQAYIAAKREHHPGNTL